MFDNNPFREAAKYHKEKRGSGKKKIPTPKIQETNLNRKKYTQLVRNGELSLSEFERMDKYGYFAEDHQVPQVPGPGTPPATPPAPVNSGEDDPKIAAQRLRDNPSQHGPAHDAIVHSVAVSHAHIMNGTEEPPINIDPSDQHYRTAVDALNNHAAAPFTSLDTATESLFDSIGDDLESHPKFRELGIKTAQDEWQTHQDYRSVNLSGHPDNWSPEELGEPESHGGMDSFVSDRVSDHKDNVRFYAHANHQYLTEPDQ